jgi:MarR family transcriptional regulator, lower aerobic nicotinate degradation pathway regulator
LYVSTFKFTPVPAFTNLSQLYSRPGFLLRRAHQISTAVFEDECKSLALTPAQFGVLSVLHASPGLDQSSLGRALGFDKVTVMRVMRGLETRGLIARVYAPTNRRNLSITLSDAGFALLAQTQQPTERAYDRLMAPLNPEQREQLVALLQLLTTGLENEARAAFVPHTQSDKSDNPICTLKKQSDAVGTPETYLEI